MSHLCGVLPAGAVPECAERAGIEFLRYRCLCRSPHRRAVVVSAIDNLVKGASGQAIQNMNLMMGFDETEGLKIAGLFP